MCILHAPAEESRTESHERKEQEAGNKNECKNKERHVELESITVHKHEHARKEFYVFSSVCISCLFGCFLLLLALLCNHRCCYCKTPNPKPQIMNLKPKP